MIKGVHTLFYSSQPEALREFFRDKLGWPCVDAGDGWLIFGVPEADMGVHPVEAPEGNVSGVRDVSFYCDDIEGTVADLKGKGVEFTQEIKDEGWGLVTRFAVPGGFDIQLYEPRYPKPPAAR